MVTTLFKRDLKHLFKRKFVIPTLFAALALPSLAADHRDSPAPSADPAADLADVFAWTTADTSQITFYPVEIHSHK